MADAVASSSSGPNAPRKQAGREKLIVGGTIALVVLTYLIYRRSQANAAAATPATTAMDPGQFAGAGYYGAPGSAAGGYPGVSENDPTILALQAEIQALEGQIAAIPVNQTGGAGGTTGSGGGVTTGGGPGGTVGPLPGVPGSSPAAAPGPNVYPPAGQGFAIGPALGPSSTGYNIPLAGPYGSPQWVNQINELNAQALAYGQAHPNPANVAWEQMAGSK